MVNKMVKYCQRIGEEVTVWNPTSAHVMVLKWVAPVNGGRGSFLHPNVFEVYSFTVWNDIKLLNVGYAIFNN